MLCISLAEATWWRHQMETFSALLAICAAIHQDRWIPPPPPPPPPPPKGQWHGALMFSLIWAWINGWVNYCEAGDLRCNRVHYDVTVMTGASYNISCHLISQQGKSEGFDSCNQPSNLAQIGLKSLFLFFLWMTSFIQYQALCIIPNPSVNSNWSYSPVTLNAGQNRRFFVPCDLEMWQMTLKNDRAPLLCCFKLCASFHSHKWIQTWVTVRKPSIRVKISDFLSRVTLKSIDDIFSIFASFWEILIY